MDFYVTAGGVCCCAGTVGNLYIFCGALSQKQTILVEMSKVKQNILIN